MGSERMTRIERAARDICWAGFIYPSQVGKTKAAYWRELPQQTRQQYMDEAKRIAWLLRLIPKLPATLGLTNAP